ncbi:MAG: SLC13 family permease [Alphaproteobacteria bacterium]|nr:MAG: SLC13 family permease [Alphaproteobacteria bacterium]
MIVDIEFHMWFGIIVTLLAVYSFAKEKISLEMTALSIVAVLLVYGQIFPLLDGAGKNQLNPAHLLAGFANPSLMAVLALLIMGQGMLMTEALRPVTRLFQIKDKSYAKITVVFIIAFVLLASALMNNTPLVILAIPILQSLCVNMNLSQSRVMIPLSFGAILGGMTTLIGSSTNLLVSSAMQDLGYEPLGFFDFTVPGLMMAGVGFIYVAFILPRFLPDRSSLATQLTGNDKQFIAELDIEEGSKLVGMECVGGEFAGLENMSVRMIQRSGHVMLPPFEGASIEKGDIVIVAATRQSLMDALASFPGFLLSDEDMQDIVETDTEITKEEEEAHKSRILAEVMITPTSRMIDMSLEQAGFDKQFGAVVLGIQRRARVVRRRLGRVRLESGDVLLIAASQASLESMRANPDFIVMAGTIRDLPLTRKAPIAMLIFLATIGSAALGLLPIPVASIAGAMAMVASGCLNLRQALRAVDRKIYLLVGAALALGVTLQVTKGAAALAGVLTVMPYADDPLVMASILFILVAITTNLLTNNACAILYTPIAMNLAANMNIDPLIFATIVVFGANCSFASPIGYQTNLMVMGPGHYRFRDFMKAGIPLMVIMWITFTLIAKYYFKL